MKITCWGTRGSIPVSGKQYLKYGGDTTCFELEGKDGNRIIIDAGTGIRELGNKLLRESSKDLTLLFTHAHWDHLMGFPFFKPIYRAGVHIDLYGCPFAQDSVKRMISSPMKAPNFPVDFTQVQAAFSYYGLCDKPTDIVGIHIEPILLSHPNQGIGYRFEKDGRSIVFLTDNELTYKHPGGLDFDAYSDFSTGADVLIHDAEFLPTEYAERTRTWGHSVYLDALQLALDAGVKRLGLCHHNQERSDQAIDDMVTDCRRRIREQGADLDCFALRTGMVVDLSETGGPA